MYLIFSNDFYWSIFLNFYLQSWHLRLVMSDLRILVFDFWLYVFELEIVTWIFIFHTFWNTRAIIFLQLTIPGINLYEIIRRAIRWKSHFMVLNWNMYPHKHTYSFTIKIYSTFINKRAVIHKYKGLPIST